MSDKGWNHKYEGIPVKGEMYGVLGECLIDIFKEADEDWVERHVTFDLQHRSLTIHIDKINDQDREWLVETINKEGRA